MSNSFSPEQIKAIEVHGGALISAGAGSGKTAVLVEHLITWIRKLKSFHENNEVEIASDLKRLVVITFTVMASQEMKMRLFERIQSLQSESSEKWQMVRKHINRIYIGTIDGFCIKIINKNLTILPLNVAFNIVSNQEWEDKVQGLYLSWQSTLKNEREKKISLVWSGQLVNWLITVLSSTPNRLKWMEVIQNNFNESDFRTQNNNVLLKILQEQNWSQLLSALFEIENNLEKSKYQDKKWYQFLQKIKTDVINNDPLVQIEQVNKINHEFKNLRVPTSDDLVLVAEAIKEMKNFFKDYYHIFADWKICLEKMGDENWCHLFHVVKSLLIYIDENYGRVHGFCFSDLSYYSQLVLINKEAKTNIPYYVVVDELQDTSELQLEQIHILAGKSAVNLYGVGDIKQAIYGFRGGQSHVFFEFEKLVEKNRIELFDNYRSHDAIVNFNNELFATLFTKTKSFEQKAKAKYEIGHQSAVEIIRWDVDDDKKILEWQQEILEYYALLDKIIKIINHSPLENIAVLFRTNDQIKRFSSLMYQENLSFQVQWKIAFEEDPLYQIYGMLMLIGEAKKNGKEPKALEKTLEFYLSLVSPLSRNSKDIFFADWVMFDAYTAFVRFIHRMNIANAFQAPFLEILKSKSTYSENNFKSYVIWLDEIKKEEVLASWTLPFNAREKLNITLQTIHASKGLQYDHVLLARISSRPKGNRRSNMPLGENNPFAVKELTFLKDPWKSPHFYYENQLKTKAQDEESLRLFYVACTRAKKSLTISLASSVNIQSWGSLVLKIGSLHADIKVLSLDDKMQSIIQQEVRLLPIFKAKIYKEWRQQYRKDYSTITHLKLMPSLSVTSLVVFERCPMKYYFKNVLSLDEEKISSSTDAPLSNSQRGIDVHKSIQAFLINELSFEDTLNELDSKARDFFKTHGNQWHKEIATAELIGIEQELRFSWKGNIILGTPDVYFVHDANLQVWDFKTGLVDEADLQAYYLQLKWYAYAVAQKTRLTISSISLKIIALDTQKIFEFSSDIRKLEAELETWWVKFADYTTKKLNHCSKCTYQVYCTKSI